jgi:hypothetical protein
LFLEDGIGDSGGDICEFHTLSYLQDFQGALVHTGRGSIGTPSALYRLRPVYCYLATTGKRVMTAGTTTRWLSTGDFRSGNL